MTMPDRKKRAENIDASMLMCESRKERIATIEMHLQQAMIASQSKVDELLEKQREACLMDAARFLNKYGILTEQVNYLNQVLNSDGFRESICNAKIGDSDD